MFRDVHDAFCFLHGESLDSEICSDFDADVVLAVNDHVADQQFVAILEPYYHAYFVAMNFDIGQTNS